VAAVVKPDELVYRMLQRLPARMMSLRTIVIVAALAVVVLVLTLGT
jgi:two-component system sensor histidine kinase PrrB